jgi:hypothetical protein
MSFLVFDKAPEQIRGIFGHYQFPDKYIEEYIAAFVRTTNNILVRDEMNFWAYNGFQTINAELRQSDELIRGKIAASMLEYIIYSLPPIPEKITVYSGIDYKKINKKGRATPSEGEILVNPGFTSVSTHLERAKWFFENRTSEDYDNPCCILEIVIPKGTQLLYFPSEEQELLLGAGARMKVFTQLYVNTLIVDLLDFIPRSLAPTILLNQTMIKKWRDTHINNSNYVLVFLESSFRSHSVSVGDVSVRIIGKRYDFNEDTDDCEITVPTKEILKGTRRTIYCAIVTLLQKGYTFELS